MNKSIFNYIKYSSPSGYSTPRIPCTVHERVKFLATLLTDLVKTRPKRRPPTPAETLSQVPRMGELVQLSFSFWDGRALHATDSLKLDHIAHGDFLRARYPCVRPEMVGDRVARHCGSETLAA